MGTASSIQSIQQDQGRTSFCTDFLRDTTCGNQLKHFSTFNMCYQNHHTEKSSRSYGASSQSKTKQPIRLDTGNLNKAILLQIVNRCPSARQPDYEDCNVPLSTEGSHKNTKAHGAHHLLNKLDFDKFDANKTTTNSLDTSCIKSSPKATVFHPQAAIYFEYDKSHENKMVRIHQDHEPTPDISWEGPLYTHENANLRSERTNYNEGNTSRSIRSLNKENNLPLILNPEREQSQRLYREEIKPQILEKTPQKQPLAVVKTEDRITRRLNLKSRSATRHMNFEITPEPKPTEVAESASIFQFKGDPLLRNYGMISSEYPGPKKLERLLNSDSKASMPPSGRLTHTRDEKSEEMQQSNRLSNSNSKPIPKHKLLLQANKMKRERSCELLSTGGAQSLGTRETTGPELVSAGRASLGTGVTLPRFTSPTKTEDSVVAQQEQQVEAKWQDFHATVSQMKKEMGEVKKQNAWLEEHRDISHQRSQNVSQTASPMNAGDPRITHFTHATLSLSSSIPHYNNDTNQRSAQDMVPSFVERIKDSIEQVHRLSPLREERLSVIREDRAERANIGESFNTQHFGTGTVDIQALQQLKNSMETFDPPSSCYESNITYQLDKERDTCVVDLLAKDNNSEYNRENYQSVISDINQKIDGILKKCTIITEKSNRSQHPTLLSHSQNPIFVDGVGDMILDDPAFMTETNDYVAARASPENIVVVENLRKKGENNEIENIIGQCYTEILKAPENQGLVTMKDDVFVKQAIQPYPVEVDKSFESSMKDKNPCIDSEPKITEKEEEEEEVELEKSMSRNYRQTVDVVEEAEVIQKESPTDDEYLKYIQDLKGLREEEEREVEIEEQQIEEQQIEDYQRRRTEGSLGTMRKSVENEEVEEDTQVNSANFPQLAEQVEYPKENIDENVRVEETFSVRSDHRNLSMYSLHNNIERNEKEQEQEEEEKIVQQEITNRNGFESSFSRDMTSQRGIYDSPVKYALNDYKTESPAKLMQQVAFNCSPPKRQTPEKTISHNSPSQMQGDQDWDTSKYPTLEIQKAAEELEALTKALHDLPQQADNFVSTAGLNAVKQTIMEKIEGIHGDILQRISQLNKKVETRSPIGHQRRNSVLDQTQDTRKFEYSTEMDPRRIHSSIKEGSRSPYSFSSQAKTESQPQSYCPSPFQSQPREQPKAFEPGLTFGQDTLDWKSQHERAALERLKKAQQKEKLAKFEPKQVSVSIMNLVDTSGDISGSASTNTNTKSPIPSKVDKTDKHQQSIKQIAEHNTINSKQSSPLSYRSSLLKSATRDGAMKINRNGKSNERDNELDAVLSSTLRRDSSSEKETKKTKSQQNSQRGLLSSQQIRQQQMSNEKEIREAFNNRQPSSPLYMSQILGTDPTSQKSRRGSYSEAKNVTTMNRSEEMWVQEEIEKKKKLAVELMNLSSLRKTRELEMPEDCMRKMEDWARSETSSWSQIPTVREKKNPSQGILKVQDYLMSEGKAGARELGEYPMSALLAKENQESDDTIFEECDTKRISTKDQGVQTVNRIVENFYLKQRRESKENGRGGGLSSLQNSMIDHSMSTSTIPMVSKRNQSQISIDYNSRTSGMKTPERRRTSSKNICLSDLEVLDTKRMSIGDQERSASRLMNKKSMSRALEKQAIQNKANKSGEKEKFYKSSNDRTLNGLPRVSKSVRDNAIAISELMQAYVLEQKERSYK